MAANTAPVLFDRALLARRLARARGLGPATFLLDRVAEDMVDRLAAVNRAFAEAADRIDLGEYAHWLDSERVVVNVYQRYRELEPQTPELPPLALLAMQADWQGKRGG